MAGNGEVEIRFANERDAACVQEMLGRGQGIRLEGASIHCPSSLEQTVMRTARDLGVRAAVQAPVETTGASGLGAPPIDFHDAGQAAKTGAEIAYEFGVDVRVSGTAILLDEEAVNRVAGAPEAAARHETRGEQGDADRHDQTERETPREQHDGKGKDPEPPEQAGVETDARRSREMMDALRADDIGHVQPHEQYLYATPPLPDFDPSTPYANLEDAPGLTDSDHDGVTDSAEDLDGDGTPDDREEADGVRERPVTSGEVAGAVASGQVARSRAALDLTDPERPDLTQTHEEKRVEVAMMEAGAVKTAHEQLRSEELIPGGAR